MQLTDVSNTPIPQLAVREENSHKGDYGRALLIGGSRGMSGAISLAGMSSLRAGAGLVTLAVPNGIEAIVAMHEPSYMVFGLSEDKKGRIGVRAKQALSSFLEAATAIGIGPGIGQSSALQDFVVDLYSQFSKPMVIDADALNSLACALKTVAPKILETPAGPRVLTPHPGEFERLTNAPTPPENNLTERAEAAATLAAKDASGQTVVVLKGHQTIVSDGKQFAINTTGNPGMATGGCGDVLTGIITALLCQKMPAFDAARLGVFLHGLAGDLAAQTLGQVSLIASDLIDFLPQAFQTLQD